MSFVAIMSATPDNRVAKFQNFQTEAEADAHVALFADRFPDAFVVSEPAEPDGHWLIDMALKTLTIDPPPQPVPTATGAQMIDEAKERGKLGALLAVLTASERAVFFTRRRIVAGSPFAEVLRAKLGVGEVAMQNFIAAAAQRSED